MEKLKIYQKALLLVKEVYVFINSHQKLQRDFSLVDQIKRAAVSVVLNIAEGYGRGTKHYKSYLKIASGSANEVIAIFQVIATVHEINTEEMQEKYSYLARQITAFANSFK